MEEIKEGVVFSMENYALKSQIERLENKIKTLQQIIILSGILEEEPLVEPGSAFVIDGKSYLVRV